MKGGHDGSKNEFYVHKANGEVDGPYGVYPRYQLQKNDVVRLVTGTGGGHGNPLHRDAEQVALDVKNGYFTVQEAEEHFGVQVNLENFEWTELPIRKGNS